MDALAYYEEHYLCSCGCGLPVAVAHDPSQPMIVDTKKCQARRALYVARRDRAQLALPPRERKKGWQQNVTTAEEEHEWLLWSVAPHDPDALEVDDDHS